MAEATDRIVTADRPWVSAMEMPAPAISARLCTGDGPRDARSGRVQMLGLCLFAARSLVIANTVPSKVAFFHSEQRSQ